MTRAEFDQRFSVTQESTEGYTNAELKHLNVSIFRQLKHLDSSEPRDIDEAYQIVKSACDQWNQRTTR